MTTIVPKKLAIYYGWPSSLNSAENGWNLDNVADDLAQYDIVVLGAGLEASSHGDHENTKTILGKAVVSNVDFYGYVTITASQSTIETAIDNWKAMGSRIVGIFCDEFGYDYGNKRSKQNDVVQYIHDQSLKAFANAWDPDDALGTIACAPHNPSGAAHKLGSGDWYLAESYQVINGNWETEANWTAKSDKMRDYKTSEDVNMATIATEGTTEFSQNKFDYCFASTVLYGFDACGWGERYYAASDAVMPYRSRMAIVGTKYNGNIVSSAGVYERNTNVGVHVDTTAHTVSTALDPL